MADPEEQIEGLCYAKTALSNTDFFDTDIEQAESNLELLSGMIGNCIMMNATADLTKDEYQRQYKGLIWQYESKKVEYDALLSEKKSREDLNVVFSRILFQLTELEEIPAEFKEFLWHALVDHMTVYSVEHIVFTFIDGPEITTML